MVHFHLEIGQPDHNAMSAGWPIPNFLRKKANKRNKVKDKRSIKSLGKGTESSEEILVSNLRIYIF